MKLIRAVLLASVLFAVSFAADKVSVQLDWKYQFEFAGFIAAKEKGYYRNAGLDVEFREYDNRINIVSEVLERRATYGVYNASIVVENGRLKPIVLLSTYFQQSPLVFIARKGISKPSDMIGKTIMGTNDELRYSSLGLLIEHFGISGHNSRIIPHTFDVDDFIEGRVDVMSAFRSNQLYELDRRGIAYEVIDPADYGFVMSAVNLFSSQKEVLDHPERTRRFIEATNRGWRYALDHPEEVIDLLIRRYGVQKSKEALRYEAEVTLQLMMTHFYEIGETNTELTTRAFKQLIRSGALSPDQKLGEFLFRDITAKARRSLTFTPDQKEYLLRKKKITMCVDPEWYPFETIREGEHIGIAADVMDIFERRLGIPIVLVPTNSWDESLRLAQNRTCDILSLASPTPSRQVYMHFTRPYVTLPIVMATTMDKPFIEDVTTLRGKKLGAVKGYSITEYLKSSHPDLEIVEVDSITEGLEKVHTGELYGYIDNLMVVSSYIQKEYTGLLKVSSRLEQKVELGVGTRSDEPVLKSIFDKLVADLGEEQMQTVYNRWATTVEEVSWIERETVLKTLGFAALLAAFFLWRYFELKRYSARLLELSVTDKLTGLFNRLKIEEKLIDEHRRIKRYAGYRSALIMIDVDHFKRVNDTHGHQEGDAVLRRLARIMRERTRDTDAAGRWGGEEFIIVLPNTTLDEAAETAEKLRRSAQEELSPGSDAVTISIGVGELCAVETVEETIGRVDQALYAAKEGGRNRVYMT